MRIDRPFHPGELEIQSRLGELDMGAMNGRAISDSIVRGAFKFVAQQPFAVLASVEASGRPWASIVPGDVGFASVVDERALELDLSRAALHPGDPLASNLGADDRIGTLFIEPGSRRRLRVNGRATRDDEVLRVDVAEAFPNCPKYIQKRHLRAHHGERAGAPAPARIGRGPLDAEALDLVRGADTFFLATGNPDGHLDASHRGGEPGFVRVTEDGVLEVPDYPGNHMYNSLGNLARDPRAGLVFLDFATGRTLQITGAAGPLEIREGAEDVTGGTNRFWTLRPEEWRAFDLPVRWEWEDLDASPFNPPAS